MATPASTSDAPAAGLRVSVITPEATIFEGDAEQVVAPAWNGSLGVRHGHAPLMALLGTGTLRIDAGGSSKSYAVSGGFLQAVDNTVTVLSESATAA